MRSLLILTSVIEAVTGLALVLSPTLIVTVLLGAPLDTPAGLIVARIAGGALLSIGTSCWLARNDEKSRAASASTASWKRLQKHMAEATKCCA